MQIHDSSCIYSSEIDYDCKDLLNGNTYKLVITVTDTYGNTISKGVYIKPDCGAVVKTAMLTVEPYLEHGSVVLDFSKLVSITGTETKSGGYTIRELTADWAPREVYTGFTLASGESTTIYAKACEIEFGNQVTWSKYDGQDKYISCSHPLISTTFQCTGGMDNQTIFELVVGNYTYKLTWEVYQFHLVIRRKYRIPVPKVVTEIDENYAVITRRVTEWVTSTETLVDDTYIPYKGIDMNAVHTAMADESAGFTVPYLMYEDMPLEETLYMHTESLAKDCWWHVVVSEGYWYMKCMDKKVNTAQTTTQATQPVQVVGVAVIRRC